MRGSSWSWDLLWVAWDCRLAASPQEAARRPAAGCLDWAVWLGLECGNASAQSNAIIVVAGCNGTILKQEHQMAVSPITGSLNARREQLCACAFLGLLAAGCAPKSSQDVLAQVQQLERRTQPDSAPNAIVSAAFSFAEFVDLAEATTGINHELLNGAYAECQDARTRALVIGLAAYRHTGRYVPLLCYAAQFDPSPEVRMRAARGLSATREVAPPLSRSVIVSTLGHLMENAESTADGDQLAQYLEDFLLKTCDYAIPGAERREEFVPTGPSSKIRVRVERSDPAIVRSWWEATGRQMAISRRFD
jgi:hypothetical protein